MKKSYYNFLVHHKDKHLIFNARSRACVVLDDEEFDNYMRNLNTDFSQDLYNMGFLVKNDLNEQKEALNTIKSNIDRDKKYIRSHTVYTTTFCNAHCEYCFEASFHREHMDRDVARKVAKYILQKQGEAKKLYIIWFGGEPLLNIEVIDIISEEIKRYLPSDVEFRSSIYSNGILFSDRIIEHAINAWNLKAVQITIDGLKDTYEHIKKYGTENSFEKVLDRIKTIAIAGLRVQVRLNYDENSCEEILKLIEYLKNDLGQYSNIFVHAHKVFLHNTDNSKIASAEYDFLIFKKLVECGFYTDVLDTIKGNMNTCLAGGEYSWLYLPNGDIIKCDRDYGSIVGNIYGGLNTDELSRWKNNRLNSKCYNCKTLPLCGGGCIYEFLNGKNGCMCSELLIYKKLQYYIEKIYQNDYNSL